MSEYINFEAEAEHIEGDEVSDFSDVSESSFIDDTDQDTGVNFYSAFTNVKNDLKQVLRILIILMKYQIYVMVLRKILKLMISKILKQISKSGGTLFPRVDKESQKLHNQIRYTILYALNFDKNKSTGECNVTEFQKIIVCDLIDKLLNKSEIIIDLQKFENMCYEINCILPKYGYFL